MQKSFATLAISLLFSTFIGALSSNIVYAEIYKQVNPDGSVSFTDKPKDKDKSSPVRLNPMSTFKATAVPTTSSTTQQSKPVSKKYTSVSITSPANEATIRDNSGNFTVTASVAPSLQSGHKMVLMDNGKVRGESVSGSFKLTNMNPGAHSLTVQIQDSAGKTLMTSTPVTAFLRRHTIRR